MQTDEGHITPSNHHKFQKFYHYSRSSWQLISTNHDWFPLKTEFSVPQDVQTDTTHVVPILQS